MKFGRLQLNLTDHQKYMMSFVMVDSKGLHLLNAFPDIIMVDTMGKNQREEIPGGKDSRGKIIISRRIFIPNQLVLMFQWVVSAVDP